LREGGTGGREGPGKSREAMGGYTIVRLEGEQLKKELGREK